MAKRITYPGTPPHPDDLPVGTIARGSVADKYTYYPLARDPATGKFIRSSGTLRLPHMTGWISNTPAIQNARAAFARAVKDWNKLSPAEQRTYKDGAAIIRRNNPNPLTKKSGWLGINVYIHIHLKITPPAPIKYDSGWRVLPHNDTITLDHNLGGDIMDYEMKLFADHPDYGIIRISIPVEWERFVIERGFYLDHISNRQINVNNYTLGQEDSKIRLRITRLK